MRTSFALSRTFLGCVLRVLLQCFVDDTGDLNETSDPSKGPFSQIPGYASLLPGRGRTGLPLIGALHVHLLYIYTFQDCFDLTNDFELSGDDSYLSCVRDDSEVTVAIPFLLFINLAYIYSVHCLTLL